MSDNNTPPKDSSKNSDGKSKKKKYTSMKATKKQMEEESNPYLATVLQTQLELRRIKSKEISFSSPIIYQFEKPLIYRNTLNVIQGKAGQHKSRLAETICSAILRFSECDNDLLQFEKNSEIPFSVLYVDTERNLKEQFPYAIQEIERKSGFAKSENPENFYYISLLNIDRQARYQTLNDYLEHLRGKITQQHLFIVLDVATDCISNFNHVDDSLKLIDMINISINNYDTTFLCIIHENPNGEKARGHLGTELLNKATTHLSISYDSDKSSDNSEIIKVKCLKIRVKKKPEPYFIKYDETSKGLVLATDDEILRIKNDNIRKANRSEEHT